MEKTTEPTLQQDQNIPTQIPETPKNNPYKILFFMLLILCAIPLSLVAGIYIGKTQTTNQQQVASQPTSNPTREVSPTALPTNAGNNLTATWKTYSNTKYGFQVKYDPSLTPKIAEQTNSTQYAFITFGAPKNTYSFDIEISEKNGVGYYKYQIEDHITQNITTTQTTIGGVIATKYTYPQFITTADINFSKVIIQKNVDYIITAKSDDIELILSTFTFANTSSVVPTVSAIHAPILSTTDWKSTSAITFAIKTPPGYTPYVAPTHDSVTLYVGDKPEGMGVMSIERVGDPATYRPELVYAGGSRREWYIKMHFDTDHPQPRDLTFVDTLYGSVSGLEVYSNNHLDTILLSQGNKLYSLSGTVNVPILQTIASTIIYK